MSYVPDYNQQRAAFKKAARNVAPMMVHALRDPVISQIDVRFLGTHINAATFSKVRHLIESGRVLVLHNPSLDPETAETSQLYDMVQVAFPTAHTTYRKSALVHEAVHVRTDMRAALSMQTRDELLGYAAQAVYLRLSGFSQSNLPGATDRRIFPAAFVVAEMLLTGNQPSQQQVNTLRSAILANPQYAGISNQILFADGVRRRQRHIH